MRKRSIFILVALAVALTLFLQLPGSARYDSYAGDPDQGCTPGYWKQPHHLDSWPVNEGLYFDEVFSLVDIAPHITLWDAVNLKGGGENRFIAHAVAAWLNQEHPDVRVPPTNDIEYFVLATYTHYPLPPFSEKTDILTLLNELGCPLE